MPYAKKNYRKKRNYRRRKTNLCSLVRRQIQRYVRPEKKHTEQNVVNNVALTTAGVVRNICEVAQGDGIQTRDGNAIQVKSWYVRETYTATAECLVRIMLFVDKQQEGATNPAVTDVLDQTYSNNILAPLNESNFGRFSILVDKIISIDPASKGTIFHKIYKRLNQSVRYIGINSTDIGKNGLYMLHVTDTASTVTCNSKGRLTFTDS